MWIFFKLFVNLSILHSVMPFQAIGQFSKIDKFSYSAVDYEELNDWVPKVSDDQIQPRLANGFQSYKGVNEPQSNNQKGFHFVNIVKHRQPNNQTPLNFKQNNPSHHQKQQQQQQQQQQSPHQKLPKQQQNSNAFFYEKTRFRNTKNVYGDQMQDNIRAQSLKPLSIHYPLKIPGFLGPTNNNRLRNLFTRNKSNAPQKPFRASQPYPIDSDFTFSPESFQNSVSSSYQNVLHSNFIDPQKPIDQSANEYTNFYTRLNVPLNPSSTINNITKANTKVILSPPPVSSAYYNKFYGSKTDPFSKSKRTTTVLPPVLYVTRSKLNDEYSKVTDFLTLPSSLDPLISLSEGNVIPMPVLPLVDYSKPYSQNRDYTKNTSNPFKIDLNEYIKSRPNLRHLQDDEDVTDDFFRNKTFVQFNRNIFKSGSTTSTSIPKPNMELSTIQEIFPEIHVETTEESFRPMILSNGDLMDDVDLADEPPRFTNLDDSTEVMNINLLKMNISFDGMFIPTIPTTTTVTSTQKPLKPATITATISRGNRRNKGSDSELCEKACIRNIINQEYNPVCVSNNRTYANKGSFRCASICGQENKLQILYIGKCIEATTGVNT